MADVDSDQTLEVQVAVLSSAIGRLETSHGELAAAVLKLNTTWDQANGTLKFIKWTTTVAAAIAAIAVAIKQYWLHAPIFPPHP